MIFLHSITLKQDLNLDNFITLLKSETNDFVRYDTFKRLQKKCITSLFLENTESFNKELQVLSDITKDYLIRDDHDHFKSYCLSFPSLSELLNDMPVYDVHKTHECKTTVIHMLLETHHEKSNRHLP